MQGISDLDYFTVEAINSGVVALDGDKMVVAEERELVGQFSIRGETRILWEHIVGGTTVATAFLSMRYPSENAARDSGVPTGQDSLHVGGEEGEDSAA